MECKICNRDSKNFLSLCRHVRSYHNLGVVQYYEQYENFNIPKCKCGNSCKHNKGLNFYKSCGNDECIFLVRSAAVTEENRNKASENLKALRKRGIGNFIQKKSVPCEKVKEKLSANNISFVEEFMPIDNRLFRIDIAFPNKKIGIEINGNQHYNLDGTLKKYYQDRHNLIEAAGWELHEYHFSIAYNSNLDDLINILKNNYSLDKFDYSFYIKPKKISRSRKEYFKIKNENWDIEQQKYIPLILNSEIEFSKFGWVGKVAKIICIPSQHVNKWMKKYMLDFYENKCFHRN